MEGQENATTAIEKVAPKDVKAWINSDKFKEALSASLPSHMTPDRFIRVALTALMKTPKLAQCTKESIFKVMLDLSSLGLEPDGRRAHVIPYNNRKNNTMEAQLLIDYKGLIELAKRSGEVVSIRAEIVCESDVFSWENGIVTHKIDWLKPRGKTLAVYSHVKNKDGVDEYQVMTLEQVNDIRKRSKAADNGPWVTDFNEMAKKTVIRRHSKFLTLSPEFHEALEKDVDRFEAIEPEFSLEDIMPKTQSEIDVATEKVKPSENVDVNIETQKEMTPEIDPESVITSFSLARILKAYQEAKLTQDKFNQYLAAVIGAKSVDKIKEKDVERVCAWIRNQSSTK